jgi:hypothetical protein
MPVIRPWSMLGLFGAGPGQPVTCNLSGAKEQK